MITQLTGPVPSLSFTEHPITVLLVDDQLMIVEAVRRMLADEPGIRFHGCTDPEAALAKAREVRPTVILQDLVMPRIDGLTLVRTFRNDEATADVPLIVLSTKEDASIKARAFALGAADYLVKLPDKVELVARIRHHSEGYIRLLERNEAFVALEESRAALEIRNRFIEEAFGKYVSEELVAELISRPEALSLGGEKRRVTVLMTDLRGFTLHSEQLGPDAVVRMLNNYFEVMTRVIFARQGLVDNFIGDAMLVLFGVPIRRDDDAVRAVACALEMQRAMAEVNERNTAAGLPELEMGIGIATGEVVVGNIGSRRRMKYGAIGRTVNLAARIESFTTGGQVLVDPATREAIGPALRSSASVEIEPKGVRQAITIDLVAGLGPPWNIDLPTPDDRMMELAEAIPVRCTRIEGKHSGDLSIEGALERMSARRGEIRAGTVPFARHDDLRICFPDELGDAYAKVEEVDEAAGRIRVRFTAMSPAIAARVPKGSAAGGE